MLNDALHSYAWDADTRPTTIDGVTVTYDALGRMVEQSNSGSYAEIVYDALGNKLALMTGTSTLKQAFVPLPAAATAVYNASGLQYYRHPDWLGSSRFASTPTRTMFSDLAFAPFGEPYAQAGSTGVTDTSFAGNNEDTTTNLYDAQFREYGIQGRWPSPDPAGVAAANPANPQSWNRYSYVLNNPLNLTDPSGKRAAPEYYDINEDEAFFAGDIFDIGGGGGGDVLFGCDEFDFIAPNSFCNQIMLPIVTGTFTVQNWNNYYATNGYSADPCVFANKDGSYTVNATLNQGGCQKAGGQWVAPGVPFTVSQSGIVQTNASGSPSVVHNVCAAIGKVGDFVGISGVAANVTGTGSIAGPAATTGIMELGVGGVSVGALELTPIGWGLTAAGLGLIGADLACSF